MKSSTAANRATFQHGSNSRFQHSNCRRTWRGECAEILLRVHRALGETEAALSAITIVELTHGIYRARSDSDRERRRAFTEELCLYSVVDPSPSKSVNLPAGLRVSRLPAASIAFEDLLIGVTALYLGYSVATLNVRHFQMIPNLVVLQL